MTEISSASAVALGFFDGIHLGHKSVIGSMLKCAGENSLISVVHTFSEHPSEAFGRHRPFVTSKEERYEIMKNMGVEKIVVDDFLAVKDLSPEQFVKEVLVERLRARFVFCGFNYHFGRGGKADSSVLEQLCEPYGIKVRVVTPVIVGGSPVSSTRIRNLLRNGKIEEANLLLDHRFGYHSVIEEGNHIGRLLETPTINQMLPYKLILPKFGVYTSVVTVGGKKYVGVTNIGVKPTVGDYEPLSETWLPKYNSGELYGRDVDVRLVFFHRSEQKFESFSQLQAAIRRDGEIALENIKRLKEENFLI